MTADQADVAVAAVISLMQGEAWDEVHARLDKTMQRVLSTADLAKGWHDVGGVAGAFVRIVDIQTREAAGRTIATASCEFERTTVRIQMVIGNGRLSGLKLTPASANSPEEDQRAFESIRRTVFAAAPLLVGIGVAAVVIVSRVAGLRILLLATGGISFVLSLAARVPLQSALTRFGYGAGRVGQAAIAGPAEEVVKAIIIVAVVRSADEAASLGLGWVLAELMLVLANGLGAALVASSESDTARTIRDAMIEQANAQSASPLNAVLERAATAAFHIGTCLLIVANFAFLPLTIAAHCGINIAGTVGNSPWRGRATLVVASIATLTLGLSLASR